MKRVFFLFLLPVSLVYGSVVAEINGRKITSEEFNRVFYTFWERIAHLPFARPTKEDKKVFLIEYVRDLIILKEAEKEGITVSRKELEGFIKSRIDRKKRHFSSSLINLIKAEIVTEKLLRKLVDDKEVENIPESKLRAYYEFYKREFRYPTSYKLIAVSADDIEAAKKAKELMEQGIIPKKMEGIELSKPLWYSRSAFPGILRRKFSSLRKGAVSEPLRLNGKYYVFKILDIRPAGTIPFEKAKGLIKLKILEEKRKEALKKWLKERIQNYRVRFYWENL
ncbi:peptidylprolyl isomerase [Aquifex sp.]